MLAAAIAAPNASSADGNEDEARWLRLAVERICPQPGLSGLDVQGALPGSWLLDETRFPEDRDPRRIVVHLLLPGADMLTVERRQFRGRLRQFRVSHAVRDGGRARPSFQAIADGGCTVSVWRDRPCGETAWSRSLW